MDTASAEITTTLRACRCGDEAAFGRLVSLLYNELRARARRERRRLRLGETLNTTSLVHEAYIKLAGSANPSWEDRAHLMAAAAKVMRHILIDAARAHFSAKRGAGKVVATLPDEVVEARQHAEDLLAVDAALQGLRELDKRLASVVECRFFGGMTEKETGQALNISTRTVRRDWLRARGWLKRTLGRGVPATATPGGGDHGR